MTTPVLQILSAMVLFTLLVVLLAALVLLVRRRLTPHGRFSVTVNDQRTLNARAGDRLLWTLADGGVLLPAACGGRGSCGQCRVTLTRGAGPALPTERAHISRAAARHGVRLACMVTVRDDLAVQVPAELLSVRRWHCRVRQTRALTPFLRELTLEFPDGECMPYQAGDYVLLEAPPGRVALADVRVEPRFAPDWQPLRHLAVTLEDVTVRAYSLASHPGERDLVRLVIRLATPPASAPQDTPPGRVSSWLFTVSEGMPITLRGPFGEFHLRPGTREKVFIGGGAGIAPMRSLIHDLLENRASSVPVSFWYGARNLRELCYRDEFAALAARYPNFSYQVALSAPDPDDHWTGPTGFIHRVVLEQYLNDHPAPEEAEYYLCGPPLMASAVLAALEDLGVERDSILFDDFGP
ncbi:MAG: NADH:ubiquinone reductase (Na(+)-transporting) subunit F [Pseudomonadales bacterium]